MARHHETAWMWAAICVAACLGACRSGPLATPSALAPAGPSTALSAPPPPAAPGETIEPALAATPEMVLSALADQPALIHLPRGETQLQKLCGRGHTDPISERLCQRPSLRSLADLQAALGLSFTSQVGNGELGNPSFALLSHTTSLSARQVSPINPRVFVFTSPASVGPITGPALNDPGFVALAFARGEPLVELSARDRVTGELRFFLVRFELACEREHCSDADLFTAAVERGWQRVSVYDDDDLENTVFDCNVCHQPGGKSTPKMLRMIEQRPPWTHFFRDNDQGKLLMADYFSAHDKRETYGGIPGQLISWSEPARLEGLVENEGFVRQPLELPTRDLARQAMKGDAPADLPAYAALYDRARTGQSLPVPFPDYAFVERATLARAAGVYRDLAKGESVEGDLSLNNLHSSGAKVRVGLAPEPDADGQAIALSMCARCHNAELDQSLSRARFNAKRIGDLAPEVRAKAIERLALPESSALKMPPPRFGSLSAEENQRLTEALGG